MAGPLPPYADVVIVGAGLGGIATAAALRRAGFDDVVLLERADDVGGTWRDNTYPGCACDIPSVLYSYSFLPNPRWTRTYPGQEEIWDYIRDAVDRLGLTHAIHCGHDVQRCTWHERSGRWQVTTSGGRLTARVLVAAPGGLSEPSVPDIPGLADFPGTVFHSSRWDHGHDLTGRRVAVVGTGASAVQLVPQIQPLVDHLHVLQRTPPWILPRDDRAVPAWQRHLYDALPWTQKVPRALTYARLESRAVGFVTRPDLTSLAEPGARHHLEQAVADPWLRAALTPDYRLGCKRVLLSDDYYPALTRSNVTLVPHGLAEVDGTTLVASDGTRARVDTVILATGFHGSDPVIADRLFGREGVSLEEAWAGSPRAYLGSTVPGFPNLFLISGPNTGLGHNSIIYMIESQARYVANALAGMRDHGVARVEVRRDVARRYDAELDRRLAGTVWAQGGCASWYQDGTGRVAALWPGYTWQFRRRTRRFDPRDYLLRRVASPRSAAALRGFTA